MVFFTLKQIVSLNIGLKRIISDYNQGHIIRELRTRGHATNGERLILCYTILDLPKLQKCGGG
jgi:hypothetical protein